MLSTTHRSAPTTRTFTAGHRISTPRLSMALLSWHSSKPFEQIGLWHWTPIRSKISSASTILRHHALTQSSLRSESLWPMWSSYWQDKEQNVGKTKSCINAKAHNLDQSGPLEIETNLSQYDRKLRHHRYLCYCLSHQQVDVTVTFLSLYYKQIRSNRFNTDPVKL